MEDWLARLDPDAIVAPYLHGPWGAALARMARPPRPIVGFDHDQGLVRRWMLERLSVRVHKRLDLHELDNLGALLGAVGLACEPEPAVIQVPSSEFRVPSLEQQNLQLETRNSELETGRAWIMFNPDAGHAQKEWTDEGWAELARRILDETECRVVINAHRPRPQLEESIARAAGPIAADGAPVAAALGRPTAGGTSALPASPRVHWLREAPLEELVAWLARCRALVTVDAGPQHLAHALGVPSVTLYGPMDERRWRDRWARPIHRIVRACAFDLTPQERRGLAENHMVARIKPCHVWAELDTLLKSTAAVAAGRG
jgi:ADP-heptose:LPS heptosyltransferase